MSHEVLITRKLRIFFATPQSWDFRSKKHKSGYEFIIFHIPPKKYNKRRFPKVKIRKTIVSIKFLKIVTMKFWTYYK